MQKILIETDDILLNSLPPLSLYIHIPWCIKKCPYCDFNSHSIQNITIDEDKYIDALLIDLQYELPYIWGRSIETIFIGGGTPSIFHIKSIDKLLSNIRSLVKLKPDAEITLEVNPGTFELNKFQGFYDAGINRLSIGVQSFDDQKLKILGRIHSKKEALKAVDNALKIFNKVNIDLMYALPYQTCNDAKTDIQIAINTGVSHISAYHLTMEPNTVFGYKNPSGLPNDDLSQDIEDIIHFELIDSNFLHYEVSAFSKNQKHQSQHNLNYWQFGDYIGIGAGAHGKISYATYIERTTRSKHPNEYLKNIFDNHINIIKRNSINKENLVFEFMMNALRLNEGIPIQYLFNRTGISSNKIYKKIEKAINKGLLINDPLFLKPTELGRKFLNDLIQIFL